MSSWADVVVKERVRTQPVPAELLSALDDSKDGINLMMRQQSLAKQQQDAAPAAMADSRGSWRDVLAADASTRKRDAREISRAPPRPGKPQAKLCATASAAATGSPFRKQGKTGGSPLSGPVPAQCPPPLVLPETAHEAGTAGPSPLSPGEPAAESSQLSRSSITLGASWADEVDREDLGSEVESWMGCSTSESETDRSSHPSQFPKQPVEDLTPARIAQRDKQVSFGKATPGYKNYTLKVKVEDRGDDPRKFPTTPRTDEKISKRAFDYKLKKWRRALHRWDPVPIPKRTKSTAAAPAKKQRSSSNEASPAPSGDLVEATTAIPRLDAAFPPLTLP